MNEQQQQQQQAAQQEEHRKQLDRQEDRQEDRKMFACVAMVAHILAHTGEGDPSVVAANAVTTADAMIKALEP